MDATSEQKRELLTKLLQQKLAAKAQASAQPYPADAIAVIGVAGRYPQAPDLTQFWQNLLAGRDCLSEVPASRWPWQQYRQGHQGDSARVYGGFISDVDAFDPQFFAISPREAVTMDPQERLFLQTAWHTIEDAGYTPANLAGGKVGVFVGAMNANYSMLGAARWAQTQQTEQIYMCNPMFWSLANRVSYTLNFSGPSLAVDTACSSSLTAIHLACDSIRRDECEVALAGGVNLILHPAQMEVLAKKGMLSATGKCHSFGQGADGFADGEGVGAVLLKPLQLALRDGDNIYAIIRGSSINAGGKTSGYTVPNPLAQASLIRRVLRQAKVDPREISYVEAHGTGTALGDPIEVRGLVKAFGVDPERQQYCALGSVKANIGHLEAAAGISGFSKILLQMRHQTLVPTINAAMPSTYIDFKNSPFYLQQSAAGWRVGQAKLAAISSFGAGGANAHVILQSFEAPRRDADTAPLCLVLLSAAQPQQLTQLVQALADRLGAAEPALQLSDIAHTLWEGRQDQAARLALLVADLAALQAGLQAYLRGAPDVAGLFSGTVSTHVTPELQPVPALTTAALSAFASAWVTGSVKKPGGVYAQCRPRRVSLPGYPFLQERYWLPELQASAASASLLQASVLQAAPESVLPAVAAATFNTPASRPAATTGSRFLTRGWQLQPAGTACATGHVLVFLPAGADAALLAGQFSQLSVVTAGPAFADLGQGQYQINPDVPEQLALLLQQVQQQAALAGIIYHWQDSAIELNAITPHSESCYAGIRPLVSLVQQLQQLALATPLLLWAQDHGSLADLSALAQSGFVKSVKAEQPDWFIRQVLFGDDMAPEAQVAALARELAQPAPAAPVVKYQQQQRWTEQLQAVDLTPALAPTAWLKPGGVYLITGGMGGLGQLLAQHIAAQGGMKLALTGRSALSESQQAWLQTLRAGQNEVVYYRCDISAEAEVQLLFEKIRHRFVHLNGILHSAGVIRDSLLRHKSWADFNAVIDSKIKGSFYLDQASAALPLDFFVAFSSVSALLGNAGQSDYAFGNAYLDALCHWRAQLSQQGLRSGKSVAVNWPLWQHGGMQIAPALLEQLRQSVGMLPLTTAQGLQMLDQIMAGPWSQVMPLYGELATLDRALARFNGVSVHGVSPAPAGAVNAAPSAAQAGALDAQLRAKIAKALQLSADRIDADKPFGDLGFDSIVLREFAADVGASLQLELSPALLFSCNTVNKLKAYLLNELAQTAVPVAVPLPAPDAVTQQNGAEPAAPATAAPGAPEPVAIIGMDGMLPGAADLDSFWQNLCNGVDPIQEVPASRFRWQEHFDSRLGQTNKSTSKWGGFMPQIENFDHQFFDLSAQEAIYMDPQQRLFLQTVWNTIEAAGYNAADLATTAVGVFVGVEFSDYKEYLAQQGGRFNAEMVVGNALNMIPNRISYYFDFTGPSEAIDTACSSSLVAIQRAVRSIQSGESTMAIAGGVSVILSANTMIGTSQLNIYSPDGRCKTFDQAANGYVKGEGVAAVLLKPLSAALRDGDNILAVIKGAAVNHGGRSNSITAPNPAAQARLLVQAYSEAGISAERVSYLELHGTATSLGDPVEVEGLKSAFARLSAGQAAVRQQYCGIGSVKSNIGHLEPAAGIAGLLKVVLSLQAGQLPANLHFNQLNPLIRLEQSPFYIVSKTQAWPRQTGPQGQLLPRVAGVSSFGFGGTNAHVVLEEAMPQPLAQPEAVAGPFLLLLSARTVDQLRQRVSDLLAWLATPAGQRVACRDLIYTLQVGRQPMAERLALTVQDLADLQQQLRQYLQGELDESRCRGSRDTGLQRLHDLLDANVRQYILHSGHNGQLARWWLLGVNFDWAQCYQQTPARRLRLPQYPFAQTRCWPDRADTSPADPAVAEVAAVAVTAPAPLVAMTPSPAQAEQADLAGQIRQKVAQLSGVALAKLSDSVHLAADLAIDSIKMMSLINELIMARPEAELQYFNQLGMSQILGQAHTLADLIDIFRQAADSAAATPATQVAVPAGSVATAAVATVDDTVPLLAAQYLFLPAYFLTNSSSLCSSVTLRGPLDVTVANAAWQQLIQRHPVLQLQWRWPGKKQATFADVQARFITEWEPPLMQCHDLRAEADQAAVLEQAFNTQLNRHWDIEQWPLHEFALYRTGEQEHVLFWSNEHLICDGLSNQQALREFLQLYAAELAGETLPLPPCHQPEQYVALVRRINAAVAERHDTGALPAVSGSFVFNPQGQQRDRSKVHFVCRKQVLSAALTAQLTELSRRSRYSINTLLLLAFARVIAGYADPARQIILQVPTGGRNYADLAVQDTLGCFAQNLSLAFDPATLADLPQALEQIQRSIDTAILYGADHQQAQELSALVQQLPLTEQDQLPDHAAALMLAAVKSNLYFPYTGQTGIANSYGPLQVLQYRAGTSNSPGSIDVLQEIFDAQLHVFVNYDQSFFSADFIEALLQRYLAALETLTASAVTAAATAEVPAVLCSTASSELAVAPAVTAVVLAVARQVLPRPLQSADLTKDLEADLGVDSIDKIRLVAQLHREDARVDRAALVKCRSLAELAASMPSAETAADAGPQPCCQTPLEQIVLQAQRTPDAIAVLSPQGKAITYRQLDQQSNQLARLLIADGTGHHDRVGVLCNRGPLMLVAILAALKTGAAYVPLDPTYPPERLRYILQHAGVRLLLTDPALLELASGLCDDEAPRLVLLDDSTASVPAKCRHSSAAQWRTLSDTALALTIDPADPMVVLFTSGSTGKPKGVVLAHAGYHNRLHWHQRLFALQPGERVAQKTSCCFDVSLWELFWPLMFGGVVCAVEKQTVANPWEFADWLENTGINFAHFVPSMFGAFISNIDTQKHQFRQLRWLAFSGEALATHTVQQWIDAYQLRVGLCNLYGPTEASIDVTYHVIRQRPADAEPVPIGKAIDQVALRVLNDSGQPVPAGTMGELYIGGIQLASGYLHEPELTAKAFIPNPFPDISGPTLYRTGDLVTQQPDGLLHYHGRTDSQVKIRGFRVELGEIENIATSHPQVQEAAVLLVDQAGTDKLILWYAGAPLADTALKAFIAKRCPDYMVPHQVCYCKTALPKNSNGKLDRKALLREVETAAPAPQLLPAGPAQKWIFAYFDEPYQWFGISQLHYREALDADCFAAAVDLLVQRHAGLRTVFLQQEQRWYQQILPQCPPLALIRHSSALQGEALRQFISELATDMAAQLQYDRWPLCRFALVSLADGSSQILWVSHHLIADLVAGQILGKELWTLYHGLRSAEPDIGMLPALQSYPAYVQELAQHSSAGSALYQQWLDYWQQQTALVKKRTDIPFDLQSGANIEASDARVLCMLDNGQIDTLRRSACELYGCNFYSVLAAPVYKLLAQLTRRSQVTVSHKLNGRNTGSADKHYFGAVGNFAVNAPLTLTLRKQDDFSVLAQAIRDGLAHMPLGGASYDWVSDALAPTLYPDHKLTSIRINYLGDITALRSAEFDSDAGEQNQRLSFAGQKRTSLVEWFFYTKDQVTWLEIAYSTHFYRPDTIERLAGQYQQLLAELVDQVQAQSDIAAETLLACNDN